MELTQSVPWQEVWSAAITDYRVHLLKLFPGSTLGPSLLELFFLLGLDRACPDVILLEVVQVENYLIRVA